MPEYLPDPDSCRHCSLPARGHLQYWTDAAGWHEWTAPTDRQRLQRMRDRRAARLAAQQPPAPAPAECYRQFSATDRISPMFADLAVLIDTLLWDHDKNGARP